ncbi:MAG: RNA polymerase sigma factor [Gammaproteobacteria bacterium]|jgi:RNA polymerase sigma-70 factor (ECF subfamily)|nr:RNA polymerase sigma factor [Gammaproteobacteria bacterium]
MAIFDLFKSANTEDEFVTLLRPYVEGMYRLAYRFCGSREDAEDLVQDLLVKLFPRINELRSIDNLQSWLATVLYRQFVDRTRHRNRSPVQLTEDGETFPVTKDYMALQPEMQILNDEAVDQVQQALLRLNEDQRILVILHDVEGYKLTEIQDMLDIPIGTLKSRLYRAREQLKKLLC